MTYRNKKTGVTYDSPCDISGGDWILDDEEENTSQLDDREETEATDEKENVQEEEINLDTLTIADLKDLAEERGIDLGDAKKKDEIVAVLTSAK